MAKFISFLIFFLLFSFSAWGAQFNCSVCQNGAVTVDFYAAQNWIDSPPQNGDNVTISCSCDCCFIITSNVSLNQLVLSGGYCMFFESCNSGQLIADTLAVLTPTYYQQGNDLSPIIDYLVVDCPLILDNTFFNFELDFTQLTMLSSGSLQLIGTSRIHLNGNQYFLGLYLLFSE